MSGLKCTGFVTLYFFLFPNLARISRVNTSLHAFNLASVGCYMLSQCCWRRTVPVFMLSWVYIGYYFCWVWIERKCLYVNGSLKMTLRNVCVTQLSAITVFVFQKLCRWSKMSCQDRLLCACMCLCTHISHLIKIKLSEMYMSLPCICLIDAGLPGECVCLLMCKFQYSFFFILYFFGGTL